MVSRKRFVPDRGDVVWLKFDPQVGHEQAGRRPALVLSPAAYNGKVGLAVMCPITTKVKGFPFEVELPEGLEIHGAILADQLRSLGWVGREASPMGRVSESVLGEVLGKIEALIF